MERAFLFLLLAVADVSSANAAAMKFSVLGNGTIAAQGEIMEDTPAQFVQFVSVHPNANLVWLDSVGGNIFGALALGLSIRRLNLSTYVGGLYKDGELTAESITDYGECDSACVWAFAGGVKRVFDPMGGVIAVHQFDFEKPVGSAVLDDMSSAQYGMTAIGLYLDEMGVGRGVLDYATIVGSQLHALPAFAVKQFNLGIIYTGGSRAW